MVEREKICLYTCVTGNYDSLKELEQKEKNIDYYCFTNDRGLKSKTWNVIYVENDSLDDITLARKIKILGHEIISENYEISVWIDGAFLIRNSINEFLNNYCDLDNYDFAVPIHHERKNVYQEIVEVVKKGRESLNNARKIQKFLEKEDFKNSNGLYETGILVRRHNKQIVKKAMKLWFSLILKYSRRDQISLPYSIGKSGLKVKPIRMNVFDNKYFEWNDHTKGLIEDMTFRTYFGDYENIKIDDIFEGIYGFKNNLYRAQIIVPSSKDSFLFELPREVGLLLNSCKVESSSKTSYEIRNFYHILGKKISFNRNPSILISGQFKKGEKIELSVSFEILTIQELVKILKDLQEKNDSLEVTVKGLQSELEQLNLLLSQIMNSRGYRLLEKIRNLKRIFK